MSAKTSIEWTATVHPDGSVTPGRTWNPVTGCSKVSPGCAHCYAEGVALRFWATQYRQIPVCTAADLDTTNTFHRPRKFTDVMTHEDRLHQPLKWRTPARIFVNSMSDLFHEDVPDSFIDRVFAVMALAPRHTFQVLTKRPERMRRYIYGVTNRSAREHQVYKAANAFRDGGARDVLDAGWPLPNVWLGPSIENQAMADRRFPIACELGEAGWNVMVSMEPLLGPVTIPDRFLALGCRAWVIPGGESGGQARPCDVAWIRSIVLQCAAAGVPAFVKQLGTNALNSSMSQTCCNGKVHYRQPVGSERDVEHRELIAKGVAPAYTVEPMQLDLHHPKGGDINEFPNDLKVREWPRV